MHMPCVKRKVSGVKFAGCSLQFFLPIRSLIRSYPQIRFQVHHFTFSLKQHNPTSQATKHRQNHGNISHIQSSKHPVAFSNWIRTEQPNGNKTFTKLSQVVVAMVTTWVLSRRSRKMWDSFNHWNSISNIILKHNTLHCMHESYLVICSGYYVIVNQSYW